VKRLDEVLVGAICGDGDGRLGMANGDGRGYLWEVLKGDAGGRCRSE